MKLSKDSAFAPKVQIKVWFGAKGVKRSVIWRRRSELLLCKIQKKRDFTVKVSKKVLLRSKNKKMCDFMPKRSKIVCFYAEDVQKKWFYAEDVK